MSVTCARALRRLFVLSAALALAPAAVAADGGLAITGISVCAPGTAGSSCVDTQRTVLGPNGDAINENGVHAISDEHASVFPPGALRGNRDYVFFVGGGTYVNPDIGVVALSGGPGPDASGQWTMAFSPDYGNYGAQGFGAVFLAPTVEARCPAAPDRTFDLGYASAGSVVRDPTGRPGSLLMVYEGANTCIGSIGGKKSDVGTYITTGVATSSDDGRTWPTYRGTPSFAFVPLPHANPAPGNPVQGPDAPAGATGAAACAGTDCSVTPPPSYGRYPALSPTVSLSSYVEDPKSFTASLGDSEPSAFVDGGEDDEDGQSRGSAAWLYVVHQYLPGDLPAGDQLPDGRKSDLTMARALLGRDGPTLSFLKWNGQAFAEAGIGGHEAPILPSGDFGSCGDPSQVRSQGSISFVDKTRQYLLTFVCDSPGDPATGPATNSRGSAWFWATTDDLSAQRWSKPREIDGTWEQWDTGTPPGSFGCPSYKGWYPTLMSLGKRPGHLAATGYAFYLWGCLGGSNANPPPRQYSSRRLTITTGP